MKRMLEEAMLKLGIEPTVLDHYPLRVRSITPHKAVWRLETDLGPKMLKRSNVREPKLLYLYEAMGHLINRGFDKVPPFISTNSGEPFVITDQNLYFLSDWVEGRESDFASRADLDLVTRTLAEFHLAAKDLELSPGAQAKHMYGKWPETFEYRCRELIQYKEEARARNNPSLFDRKYIAYADYFHGMGQQALRTLANSRYQELVQKAKLEKCYCHRDVAGRNFIITPDRQCFLIDFDYSRFDIRITDIVRLLERTLKKVGWDIDTAKHILNIYNAVYPISKEEYPIVLAFLQFPQKFWRVSCRYYTNTKEWPEKKYLTKINLLIKQKKAKELFLEKFAISFC